MKSKRKEQAEKRRRQKMLKNLLTWGGIAAVIIVIAIFGFSNASQNPGESVPVMPVTGHVTEGADPGPFSTNPPTSGQHYGASWQPAFYNEPPADVTYPEGYLVHSLEHGYIIFWYNCDLLDEQACTETKSEIQAVMDAERMDKVIAYPWTTTDVPVVLTSWGRMMEMETFDSQVAREFVQKNRNQAPEPHAE